MTLDALRALSTLLLTFVALRTLGALDLLRLLLFLTMRTLGALAATLPGFGSLSVIAAVTFLLRRHRSGHGEAGNTGDQYHLAGHE